VLGFAPATWTTPDIPPCAALAITSQEVLGKTAIRNDHRIGMTRVAARTRSFRRERKPAGIDFDRVVSGIPTVKA
jgi:hypothetical protein